MIFFTAIALSDNEVEGHEALMLGLGVAGFLVQAFVKMYYMVHAFFDEYKFVDVAGLNGTKIRKRIWQMRCFDGKVVDGCR